MQSNIQSVEEQNHANEREEPDSYTQTCIFSSANGIRIESDKGMITDIGLSLALCLLTKAIVSKL